MQRCKRSKVNKCRSASFLELRHSQPRQSTRSEQPETSYHLSQCFSAVKRRIAPNLRGAGVPPAVSVISNVAQKRRQDAGATTLLYDGGPDSSGCGAGDIMPCAATSSRAG